MKGFKININDAGQRDFAVHEGVVILTISYQLGVCINGGDDTEGVSLKWKGFPLATGDKIRITPSESLCTEPAVEVKQKQNLEEVYRNLEQLLMERDSSK